MRDSGRWTAALSLVSGPLAVLAPSVDEFLSPAEALRYRNFPADRRRFSFLAGRVAAKTVTQRLHPAADAVQLEIAEGVFGQPVVLGGGLAGCQVTISHTDQWGGAIAYPEAHPMGLDIESVRSDSDATIASQMNPRELALLQNLPGTVSTNYALGWSIKESLSKVLKTGLMAPFSIFEISAIAKAGPVLVSTFTHFAQYQVLSVTLGETVLSVALPKKTVLALDFLSGLAIRPVSP